MWKNVGEEKKGEKLGHTPKKRNKKLRVESVVFKFTSICSINCFNSFAQDKLITEPIRIYIMVHFFSLLWTLSIQFQLKKKLSPAITLNCQNFTSNQFYSFFLGQVDHIQMIYQHEGHLQIRLFKTCPNSSSFLKKMNLKLFPSKIHISISGITQCAPMPENIRLEYRSHII